MWVEVDMFLQYLCNKYFVFNPMAELDEANTIDDIEIIKKDLQVVKKSSDENMIKLCSNVLKDFKCYNIDVKNDNSDRFGERISSDLASNIYLHYKRYKCSSNTKTRETETSLILDNSLNTKNTYYVGSLDTVMTSDLENKFGSYVLSGSEKDDFRYEYRFRFAKNGKVYIFSIYDYKDDNGEFYVEKDIYWHIASNTDNVDVNNSFIKLLAERLQEVDDCC